MEFRSPNGADIRIALLSGHTAIVGAEFRELAPIFHRAAVAAGCERRDQPPPPAEAPVLPSTEAMHRTVTPDAALRGAITTMLEREVKGDFTADSLPNTNVVSKLCGFSARKEDVLRVFRAMKDEAGKAED